MLEDVVKIVKEADTQGTFESFSFLLLTVSWDFSRICDQSIYVNYQPTANPSSVLVFWRFSWILTSFNIHTRAVFWDWKTLSTKNSVRLDIGYFNLDVEVKLKYRNIT